MGFGGGAPEAREIIKKLGEKSTETCKILKIFMDLLDKANFNKS